MNYAKMIDQQKQKAKRQEEQLKLTLDHIAALERLEADEKKAEVATDKPPSQLKK